MPKISIPASRQPTKKDINEPEISNVKEEWTSKPNNVM